MPHMLAHGATSQFREPCGSLTSLRGWPPVACLYIVSLSPKSNTTRCGSSEYRPATNWLSSCWSLSAFLSSGVALFMACLPVFRRRAKLEQPASGLTRSSHQHMNHHCS